MRARNDMAAAGAWREPASRNQLARAADVLRNLADPTRLHLLWLLSSGPHDVTELTAQVEASRSSVSQHLGRLRLSGLVHADREGRRMLYSLTSDHLAVLIAEAYQYAAHDLHDLPHHPDAVGRR